MNERIAFLVVLFVACIITMNVHQFVTQFSSSTNFAFTPTALAENLPVSEPRDVNVLEPPRSPNVLQNITAESFYVSYEAPNARLLVQYEPYEVKSLASLTKLMTAISLLTYEFDWEAPVKIIPEDIRGGARTVIRVGDRVAIKDLWTAMLVGSDNDATAALVRHVAGSEQEFVKKMNNKADEMGLQQTQFVDPTGLEPGNVSTSREYAMVARAAFKESAIRDTLSHAGAMIKIDDQDIKILSTDQRIRYKDSGASWSYIAGKTGFTYAAGYTAAVVGEDKTGSQILAIVLRSSSDQDRANDVGALIEWATRQ